MLFESCRGINELWHDSVAYQASRVAPFSIWGLWGGLGLVQHLLQGGAVALAIVVAVRPTRRGLVEVALRDAALLSVRMGSGGENENR